MVLSESSNTPDPSHDKFQQVLKSFEQLSSAEDPIKLEFELIQQARSLKLPISSYRKMYRTWTSQQKGGQGNA